MPVEEEKQGCVDYAGQYIRKIGDPKWYNKS